MDGLEGIEVGVLARCSVCVPITSHCVDYSEYIRRIMQGHRECKAILIAHLNIQDLV